MSKKTNSYNIQSFIENLQPLMPLMPLIHTTGSINFSKTLEDKELFTKIDLKYYGESLLYLFYGKPAYNPLPNVLNTSSYAFRPVCIVLNSNINIDIKRIMTLDSGAFIKDMFKEFYPSGINKENFEIEPNIISASKLVRAFFGSNDAYFSGIPKADIDISPINFIAQIYKAIISNSLPTVMDCRRSCVEIQVKNKIPLNAETVKAVALPSEFIAEPEWQEVIIGEWQADVIPYHIYMDRPMQDTHLITDLVRAYLEKNGGI